MCKYNAESPKQGSGRFNYIVKTKHIADLGIVCLWLSALYLRIYCTAIGDPAPQPGIPQLWYWHVTVRQGSVRFNKAEDKSATCIFLTCFTFSMLRPILRIINDRMENYGA